MDCDSPNPHAGEYGHTHTPMEALGPLVEVWKLSGSSSVSGFKSSQGSEVAVDRYKSAVVVLLNQCQA